MAKVTRSSETTSVESRFLHDVAKTFKARLKSLFTKKSTTRVYSDPASVKELDKDKVLTYKDLELLTDNFSEDNFIGRTTYGHLFKGLIPENWKGYRSGEVTIKMWKNEEYLNEDRILPSFPDLIRHNMEQEIRFLQLPDIALHPYTVNVMGYCLDDNSLGVVYDLKPLHTLKNHIDNHAETFGWLERVSVAVKLASQLKFIHEHVPQYIVRNLSPAHVMLDQDLNPFLIDYSMIHGGSLVDMLAGHGGAFYGSQGYRSGNELMVGYPTKRSDIHAYGVILLEIIRQCTYYNNKESKYKKSWTEDFAWSDYVRHKEKCDGGSGGAAVDYSYPFEPDMRKDPDYEYSFAHESMKKDPDYDADDGNKISILGLRCVEKLRPSVRSMGELLKELNELKVVQSHPEMLLLDGVH